MPADPTSPTPRLAHRLRQRAVELFADAVDQASSYLPVLLMALLAVGTWWLVKNTPLLQDTPQAAAPRHEPDYTMNGFLVQRFNRDGSLKAQIEGDRLRHYPDTDTLEIDNARLRAIAPDGRVTIATAQRALSNGDGSEVQLLGGAQVVREALNKDGKDGKDTAIEFRGEFLHAFLQTEQVRSHLPVVVTQGGSELRADRLDYDNLSRVLTLKGRVRGSLPARAPRPAASAAAR